MRNGSKGNLLYLTSENLECQFGFSYKASRSLEKCRPNPGDGSLLAMMMDLNPSNTIMLKLVRFFYLAMFAS